MQARNQAIEVFPARAGMSQTSAWSLRHADCVPRASGDEPMQLPDTAAFMECSPRERG